MSINPENKCFDLDLNIEKLSPDDSLVRMMIQQEDLQQKVCDTCIEKNKQNRCHAANLMQCLKFNNLTFVQRIKLIEHFKARFDGEFVELMDRFPHKHWKEYSKEVLEGKMSEEDIKENNMELADMMHFFLNMILLVMYEPGNRKNTAEVFAANYFAKKKENVDRQRRDY